MNVEKCCALMIIKIGIYVFSFARFVLSEAKIISSTFLVQQFDVVVQKKEFTMIAIGWIVLLISLVTSSFALKKNVIIVGG